MTNSVSTCDTISPPTTAIPSGWRNSELAPVPIAMGNVPISTANVVIRIGRNRISEARWIASWRHPAFALQIECDVDHHDRVLLDDADEHQHANDGDDPEVELEDTSVPSAPTAADGRPVRMVSGWMKLS